MKAPPIVYAGLCAMSFVSALDWGKMNQYNSKLDHRPKLSGTTIWLSGKADVGFDIVLSPDAQAKVEGVLEGCGTADDNKCYQDVEHAVNSADFELDSNLERRELAKLFTDSGFRNTPKRVGILSSIMAMLFLNWKMKADKMDNSAFRLPISQAKEAASSASSSSLIFSAGGSVVVTFTPTPVTPSLTGSVAPAITTAPSNADGHKQGDVVAALDANLARRINEVAHRMTDCADGRNFDSSHGTRRRGGGTTYGQALCAAEGIVGMTGQGGAFADLTMLSHDKIGIQFAANAGKAKDALVVLKDFIVAYAPMMVMPEQMAEELGTYILAIIIDAMIIENVPIGPMNYIDPNLAVTYGAMSSRPTPTSASATSTSSSTGCPDPSKTPIFCGDEGDICEVKLPDNNAKDQQDPICADSKWKGCRCFPPTINFETVMGQDEYWGLQTALSLYKEFKDGPPIKDSKISCTDHKLSAPIKEKDADHSTSVEQAIETWCNDNDGKDIGKDGIFWRWGVTEFGVPDRSSFWLRVEQTCDKTKKFSKQQCKKSLTDGLKQCDKRSETHGFRAEVDCLAYHVVLSGDVDPNAAPWVLPDHFVMGGEKFPPPLDKEAAPKCDPGKGHRPVVDEDLNKAISAFCRDGAEIKGFGNGPHGWGNMFDYPPKNEPQWYPGGFNMHLTMGAQNVNNGAPLPYNVWDMGWCNYDYKMGRDDCTYALRKLYNTCSKDRAKELAGGEITYRCVKYKSWGVNMRPDT